MDLSVPKWMVLKALLLANRLAIVALVCDAM
jgi:hypothetical protein